MIHQCTRSPDEFVSYLRAENNKISRRWTSHRLTLYQNGRLAPKRGRSPYGSCWIAAPQAGERRVGPSSFGDRRVQGLLWSDKTARRTPFLPGRPPQPSIRYRGESVGLQRGELSTSERCAFEATSGHGALEDATRAPLQGRNQRLCTHVGYPGAAIGLPKSRRRIPRIERPRCSGSGRTDPLRARWEYPVFAHSGRLGATLSGRSRLRR